MSLKTTALKIGLPVLLIVGLARYCDRPVITPTEPGKLAPTEKERIEIKGRTVTVIRADKTTKTYAPGGAKVSIGKDGRTTVTIKKFGLTREPGLGAAWNGDKLKLSIDLKLVYYRRLGLHLGGAFDPGRATGKDILKPLAFISYTVPSDSFANTSLWVGAELFPKKYAAGIRLAF